MLLKNHRLTIRSATEKDAEQLALWWNDGKIMAHAEFPNGTGETAKSIADHLRKNADTTRLRHALEYPVALPAASQSCTAGPEAICFNSGSTVSSITKKHRQPPAALEMGSARKTPVVPMPKA